MNPYRRAYTRLDMLDRALMIQKTLGTRSSAGYMRLRGFSLEAALTLLVYMQPLIRQNP